MCMKHWNDAFMQNIQNSWLMDLIENRDKMIDHSHHNMVLMFWSVVKLFRNYCNYDFCFNKNNDHFHVHWAGISIRITWLKLIKIAFILIALSDIKRVTFERIFRWYTLVRPLLCCFYLFFMLRLCHFI